jgi:hypothetical protein
MRELLLLLVAFGVVGLGFLYYQSIYKPQMIRWNCEKEYNSDIAVNICVEAHKIHIKFNN